MKTRGPKKTVRRGSRRLSYCNVQESNSFIQFVNGVTRVENFPEKMARLCDVEFLDKNFEAEADVLM